MGAETANAPEGLIVGCSGFDYPSWRGRFYPDDLDRTEWLSFYADRFPGVEINNTFYSLPEKDDVRAWRAGVSPGFRFAVKLSRYGTHMKHLKDPDEWLPRFYERLEPLGAYLGCVLVQCPPHWNADPARLRGFLDAAPDGLDLAVEFRDRSWLNDEILGMLGDAGAALVVHDLLEDHPWEPTADFCYLRYHGPDPDNPYHGGYPHQRLVADADRIAGWLDGGRTVYAFFNNDAEGDAPGDARDLARYVRSALGGSSGRRREEKTHA